MRNSMTSNSEKNMPAFIRYPFFGCLVLVLSACGSSGSSTLLQQGTSSTSSAAQESYPNVDYLIPMEDIPTAIAKFDTAEPSVGTTAAELNSLRDLIVKLSSRYLSTGAIVAKTDNGSVENEFPNATCTDRTATGPAKCVFDMDSFRGETTFHLGPADPSDDETIVSFQSFMADRQPAMLYRQTFMSQVRTALGTNGKDAYVGYDGMLGHSMFFVGVYKFFDGDSMLQHTRLENASLGQIYDEDALMENIQSPSVALTGEGVMVGIESKAGALEHYLVQGDVNIAYDSSMIDIDIENIKRLTDDNEAWYESESGLASVLNWKDLLVKDSKFASDNADLAQLEGSFYGTKDKPEVGGVFQHSNQTYSIIGSFGSKLEVDQ